MHIISFKQMTVWPYLINTFLVRGFLTKAYKRVTTRLTPTDFNFFVSSTPTALLLSIFLPIYPAVILPLHSLLNMQV